MNGRANLISRKIFAGPRLKRLRRERQMTQARMAEELDVSPSYLNLMERNQRPITVQVLIRLADVYGIDPREFMEGEGEQTIGEMEQILADPCFATPAFPARKCRTRPNIRRPCSPPCSGSIAPMSRRARRARRPLRARRPRSRRNDLRESPIDRIRAMLHDAAQSFR